MENLVRIETINQQNPTNILYSNPPNSLSVSFEDTFNEETNHQPLLPLPFDLNQLPDIFEDDPNEASSQPLSCLSSPTTINGLGRQATNKRLTNGERQHIVELIMTNLQDNGKPIRGQITQIAKDFNVSSHSVSTIWKIVKEQITTNQQVNVKTKVKVGRKKTVFDLSTLSGIPLRRRTNIRSLSKALGISKSTTHRLIQAGEINAHTNAIKPQLTEENLSQRLAFILSKLQPIENSDNSQFQDMSTTIHIDEKWFYMSRMLQRYYLGKNEVEPHRSCKSKRFNTKVMFLGGVTLPKIDDDGHVSFDGKIGIFPFTLIEPARRKSKNRAAGHLETKSITSVTKAVIKNCLINQVIPAIKAKWPLGDSRVIYIQQDNARPHISPSDPDFIKAATSDGFDIQLTFQPSNSPDLNVLDLGFFNAIQSLQHEHAPRNVVELVEAVHNSFDKLQPETLRNVWLSLQHCMTEILKCKGVNSYKVPHVGKARLSCLGILPSQVVVDANVVKDAVEQLQVTSSIHN